MVVVNAQLSAQGMRQEVLTGQRTLDTFRQDVNKYLDQQHQIQALPAAQDCGIVRINLQVSLLKSLHFSSCRQMPLCSRMPASVLLHTTDRRTLKADLILSTPTRSA